MIIRVVSREENSYTVSIADSFIQYFFKNSLLSVITLLRYGYFAFDYLIVQEASCNMNNGEDFSVVYVLSPYLPES